MREARYAENAARGKTASPKAKAPDATAPTEKKAVVRKPAATKAAPTPATEGAETEEALCGHLQHERAHVHPRAGTRGQEPPLLVITDCGFGVI
ncbi:hypothetical protein [Nocardioides sp. B-3]|uniref:hypothetical protein n=1 Tax=Nocardioides sp. B-3 TaxID=2895565 RepID=UPI002152CEB2|nr:hypothetical protein [Nocardioides sp. B-3]UUZ58738.1 hypothetical protein LP418_21920 [Nocardioides sp. B-3]